jgi:MoaA/NifB/PqqE/SkfB family radical SAM enzyme
MDALQDAALVKHLETRNMAPSAMLIQIARICNLRCVMCGWKIWGRNKGFMSPELYKRVLSEMKLNGIERVCITSAQGEPLLNPRAIEFLELALNDGFNVILNTNITPLNERKISELCRLAKSGRLLIQASFAGYDKKSYESVYVGAKFEATVEKLWLLNKEFIISGLEKHLTINGIVMSREELDLNIKFLESIGFDSSRLVIGLPDNFAGIVQVGKKHGKMYSYKADLPYRGLRLCGLFAHYIVVYDNGKVSACACRDSEGVMEIGDITKESLYDIRNGPRFKAMLSSFMRRDLSGMPLCQKCDIPYGDHENVKLQMVAA